MPAAALHLALSCLLVSMLPAYAQEPPSRPTSGPEAFAREWIEAWNSHNVDRILTYYTDDALYEDVPSVENGWSVPLRGHQMIRESVAAGFEQMSDLGFDLVSAFDAGDHKVVEWIMTGTHYGDSTGRFSIRGVSVMRLEGDKIASVRDYYDAYLLLTQLGVVPPLDANKPEPIEEFVRKYEETWQSHSAERLAEHFAEDADMIVGILPRISGRAAIENWWDVYYSRIDSGRVIAISIESVRVPSPDIALLDVETTTGGTHSETREVLESRRARGTWMVTRVDDDWKISALRAYSPVGEQRQRPGTDN
jgi:steroid delta-isomerase-like uncharacterized protein/uncharacterized protein (TIGR02246 family)